MVVCSKCKGQFFYDSDDNTFYIAVPEESKHIVTKELEEYQRRTSFKFQLDEPVESQCQRLCGVDLGVGSPVASARYMHFMFSGTVIDETTGITVAHAVNADQEVVVCKRQNNGHTAQDIGRCIGTFQDIQVIGERSECTMTADMAVLDLLPDFYLRRNSVKVGGREFSLKIYKGRRIPAKTPVMVIDQKGELRKGIIRKPPFTDTFLETKKMKNLYNVMGIGAAGEGKAMAITSPGDSGALVLSMPPEKSKNAEDDVLFVYGIVIALYSWKDHNGEENSLTISNVLGGVIPEVFSSTNVIDRVRNIPVDNIDFTQIVQQLPAV